MPKLDIDKKLLSLSRNERKRIIKLLRDSLEVEKTSFRTKTILSAIESVMGIKMNYKSRLYKQAWARRIAAYQMLNEGMSLSKIGVVLHKDHSTVNHMRNCMETVFQYPKMYSDIVQWWNEFVSLLEDIDAQKDTSDIE